MNTKTIHHVRGFMLIAGLFFLIIGIVLNFMLYASFSDDPYYRSAYISMGLGFDITKSMMLIVAILLWLLTFYILSTFAWLFWGVLTTISILAGFGFMTVVQNEAESAALLASAKFQAAKADVDTATRQVEQLSRYANALQAQLAQSKIDELDEQLARIWDAPAYNSLNQKTGKTVRFQLSDCPGTTWYHRKYCTQIQTLQIDIKEQQILVDKHNAYLAALAHKETMLKKLSELDVTKVGITSHIHPMFFGISQLTDHAAKVIKFFFLFSSSIVAELLSSFCLLVYGRLDFLLQSQTTNLAMVSSQNVTSTPIQTNENMGLAPPACQSNSIGNIISTEEIPAVVSKANENMIPTTEATQVYSTKNTIPPKAASAGLSKTNKDKVLTKATQSNLQEPKSTTQGDIENINPHYEQLKRDIINNITTHLLSNNRWSKKPRHVRNTFSKRYVASHIKTTVPPKDKVLTVKTIQGDIKNVDPRYEQLKKDVVNGIITNLSFDSLGKFLECTDNKILKKYRIQLVADRLAVFDATRKCIPIDVTPPKQ